MSPYEMTNAKLLDCYKEYNKDKYWHNDGHGGKENGKLDAIEEEMLRRFRQSVGDDVDLTGRDY